MKQLFSGFVLDEESVLVRQLKDLKILFCDETSPRFCNYFLQQMKAHQSIVFFASHKRDELRRKKFTIFNLTCNLRSTYQLSKFANDFSEGGPRHVIPALPNKNFHGEPVEVEIVQQSTANEEAFVTKCVSAVRLHCERNKDLGLIAVIPVMDKIAVRTIIEKLQSMNYDCYSEIKQFLFKSRAGSQPEMNSDTSKPRILFCSSNEIEGCEFPLVLLFIDAEHFESFMFPLYGSSILTAVTRASFKVVIIVKDCRFPNEQYMANILYRDQQKELNSAADQIEETVNKKPSVLFIGELPNNFGVSNDPDMSGNSMCPAILGMQSYSKNNGASFLHIDDLYLHTDLHQLFNFGIRECIIANKDISCPWNYFFYMASLICIRDDRNFINLGLR